MGSFAQKFKAMLNMETAETGVESQYVNVNK